MKICFVTPFADPEKGASIVRVNSYRQYFESHGQTVTVLSPSRPGVAPNERVIRYRGVWGLVKKVWSTDFDVLMGTSPPIPHVFFSLLVCKLKGKPVVLDSKDIFSHTALRLGVFKKNSFKFWAYRVLENLTHQWADQILVLDLRLGRWLSKNYGIPSKKIRLAANGVDPHLVRRDEKEGKKIRQELKVPPNVPLLIYLGGLFDEQYLGFLENAAPILNRHNAHVLFVIACQDSESSRNEIQKIRGIVKQQKMENRFFLVQNIEHRDVYRYLSAADIGLDFWSHLQHFAVPVKIMEYMACGLPVLVKTPEENESFREFFEQYDVGLSSGDWTGFNQNLSIALEKPRAFAQKGANSINIVKSEFTREITNKSVLKLLLELAKR